MKKFKTFTLCLLAFIISISIFTGCGPQGMAELKNVDFAKAETMSAEDFGTFISTDAQLEGNGGSFSLNVNVEQLKTNFSLEGTLIVGDLANIKDWDAKTPITKDFVGKLAVNGTVSNEPIDEVYYLKDEKIYLTKSEENGYISLDTFQKMIEDVINNTELDVPEINLKDLLAVLADENIEIKKVVNGEFAYYQIVVINIPETMDQYWIDLIQGTTMVFGFENNNFRRFYVKNSFMEFSINIGTVSIEIPQDLDSYNAIDDIIYPEQPEETV